ncbi:MAG: DUF624 domain-containing protein [Cytobacillus gottheilii]|uniref:DUF624 domain-containing protein n=1 Tax=Cytobacillus gottheilii TaxID=859144 RepID=UPI00082BCE35|nr:DUF624 domain-containing protein [Cytobacillus gottheilii]
MVRQNKVFEVLENIVDLVILNFLFILCSIPIVTAIPAFVALVGSVKSMYEEDSIPAWKQFLLLFYQYIKKGVKIWIVLLFISVVIIGDIIAVFYMPNELQNFLLPLMILLVLLFSGIGSNLIKLFILGESHFKPLFITSFILFIRKPLKPLLIIFFTMLIVILSIYLKFVPFFISFSLIAFTVYLAMFEQKSEYAANQV